jgi:alkaline phosphatase D
MFTLRLPSLWLALACALAGPLTAQNGTDRVSLNPYLAPFYHGVASGDPLTDRVILWTRITDDQNPSPGTIAVDWEVALDTAFATIVASGATTTDDTRDNTVKVDAAGLQPGTWYYYRFRALGGTSLTGRTRTLPTAGVSRVRFGIVSCSNYPAGYFNAYERLADRNDVDAILHLGDYIYEGGGGSSIPGRGHSPANEIITLAHYRARYSQYRQDPDLMWLHQVYPFITVWDDHESANDAWRTGAENHTPGTEGDWNDRLAASVQAYHEWLPIRDPNPTDLVQIYRDFDWGGLLRLLMLDTRIIGRDQQVGTTNTSGQNDPARTMLGANQLAWLSQQLQTSTQVWRILGQQVMFAPLGISVFGNFQPFNADQWDGYAAERQRVLDTLEAYAVNDVVVLTGDIHTAWANDVPLSRSAYNASTGAGSRLVEFVTTSVTSGNAGFPVPQSVISSANPWVKYANLNSHGYCLLDVDSTRVQGDFWNLSTISTRNETESWEQGWYTALGTNRLQAATAPAPGVPVAILPPRAPEYVGRAEATPGLTLVAAYPNPFVDRVELQFVVYEAQADMALRVTDLQGRLLQTHPLGPRTPGIHVLELGLHELPAGAYLLQLESNGRTFNQRMVKFSR